MKVRNAAVVAIVMLAGLASTALAQQSKTDDPNANVYKERPAGVQEEKPASAQNPMEVMSWFSGHWRANVKAQNGNPPLQVDAEMKWAQNRRAMSFEVWFTQLEAKPKKAAEYYGMYFWDPQKDAIRMLQVNSKGDLSMAEMKADGNRFTQQTHVERVNGTTQEQRSVIDLAADRNSFHWKVQVQKDGNWVDALELDYRRVISKKNVGGGVQ